MVWEISSCSLHRRSTIWWQERQDQQERSGKAILYLTGLAVWQKLRLPGQACVVVRGRTVQSDWLVGVTALLLVCQWRAGRAPGGWFDPLASQLLGRLFQRCPGCRQARLPAGWLVRSYQMHRARFQARA